MGQIQFYDGKVLFVGGQVAMHEDCCCPPPCYPCSVPPEGCYQNQPAAYVDVPNDDCRCEFYTGWYSYREKRNTTGYCLWVWRRLLPASDSILWLIVSFDKVSSKFHAVLCRTEGAERDFMVPCWLDEPTTYPEITGIECNCDTGNLEGDFELVSDRLSCENCTATVSLG